VAVHTLRRTLESFLSPGEDRERNPLRLTTCEQGYVLEVDSNAVVDFEIFDNLVHQGHDAEQTGCPESATSSYREAVELYAGDFLDGVEADWARVHREWLRGRYLYTLRYLTNADLAVADHLSVVRWCRLMIDTEPFCEDAYRALIIAHAQLGHLGQVRRWYQVCADRLYKELQTAPAPETERVYAQALHGEIGSTTVLR
jgi:DNA-binding SARP family transcriptional activator